MEDIDKIEVELYKVFFTDYPELHVQVPGLDMAMKVKSIIQLLFPKKIEIEPMKKLR